MISLFYNVRQPTLVCCLSHRKSTKNPTLAHKIIRLLNQEISTAPIDYSSLIRILSTKRMPYLAEQLVNEIKSQGFVPDYSTLSSLMLCYARNDLLLQSRAVWDQILSSSFVPSAQSVSELIHAYGDLGHFDEINQILHQLSSRSRYCNGLLRDVYSAAISYFGKGGQLDMMESTLKLMVSNGFSVDSSTANAFVEYYSLFGSLTQMEAAYSRLKQSRFLLEKQGIEAMSVAYIKQKKLYRLGEFVRDVGLSRKNVGNLLWNLLLVSYAANFKMKSLQREFMSMLEAGFLPDVTTFNIRVLAFSRMSLFWDLHVSLEHMKHEKVSHDLVTYGCVVDVYLERRLGRNLVFALNKMNVEEYSQVATDPFVFEVMGKGDFHSSSEALLEFSKQKKWTYKELIAKHLRKQYRTNQIFWNY